MLSYSLNLTGYRIVTRLGTQLDRVLIGFVSGAAPLGLYDVARRWAYFPVDKVYQPMFDVAVSSFSRAQHDARLYRKFVRRGLLPLFALSMPALAFAVVEAEALILFLLGPQWDGAVPLFRLLALAVWVGSLQRVTKWFYMAEGTTQRQLRWGLISTPVLVAAVAVGAFWGAMGVAVAFAAAIVALTGPALAFSLHTSPITGRDIAAATWRSFTAAGAAAAALYLAAPLLPQPEVLAARIAVSGLVYGVLYVVTWVGMPGGLRAAVDLLRFARGLRPTAQP
jgi:PST family polysaccharide transporter